MLEQCRLGFSRITQRMSAMNIMQQKIFSDFSARNAVIRNSLDRDQISSLNFLYLLTNRTFEADQRLRIEAFFLQRNPR
jgi:hypothetical protein